MKIHLYHIYETIIWDYNMLILCMLLPIINKFKFTHLDQGHIKVKVKNLHTSNFMYPILLSKQVVCIWLKCVLVLVLCSILFNVDKTWRVEIEDMIPDTHRPYEFKGETTETEKERESNKAPVGRQFLWKGRNFWSYKSFVTRKVDKNSHTSLFWRLIFFLPKTTSEWQYFWKPIKITGTTSGKNQE